METIKMKIRWFTGRCVFKSEYLLRWNISPSKQILSGGRLRGNDGLTGVRHKPEEWLAELLNLDIHEDFLPAIPSRTCPKGKTALLAWSLWTSTALQWSFWESRTKINSTPHSPHFPSNTPGLFCRGWKWKSLIPRTWKPWQNWSPLSPQLGGQRGCPGASVVGPSDVPLVPLFRSPMSLQQRGPCPTMKPLVCLPYLGACWFYALKMHTRHMDSIESCSLTLSSLS